MKKVFIMSSVHEWNDNRIFIKEASSLAKHYQVELHALANFSFKYENGINIYGLPRLRKRYGRPLNWVRLFWRALKAKAHIYHFHDPELIPIGLALKMFGRKVIYDVHEDYPDAIIHKYWIPVMARGCISRVYCLLEKKCSAMFDALILADTTMQENFKKVAVLKEDILNYPLLMSNEKISKDAKDQVNLIYAGSISENRGAIQMIEALSLLRQQGFQVHLYLVGPINQPGFEIKLKKIIRDNKLDDYITITGKIPPSAVYNYYNISDIGLALLHPVENYLKYMATKLFEYMSAGIPIVASNFPRWETMLKEVGAGLTVDPLDPKAIATTLGNLISNPELRSIMGVKGYSAFNERFNWGSEEKKLIKLYTKMV